MRIAVFSTKPYDRQFLLAALGERHEPLFHVAPLDASTAALADGCRAVCPFVNDRLNELTLSALAQIGVGLVTLRCAGYNNVDLKAARRLGIAVTRVPAYSPHAVAEHTVALMLLLNRKIYRAHNRVREGNFSIDGLLGFDMHGRTAGVIGTGRIGAVAARILRGFGMRVLATDPYPDAMLAAEGIGYVPLEELLAQSDIVTLHCPLTPETHHLIDKRALGRMQRGAMLVNTSRGALVDARALIGALKSGQLGSVGLDVYEEEADVFFEDLSDKVLQDDVLARLLTFPNVVITAHQGFFTRDAVENIAATTLANIDAFEQGRTIEENTVVALAESAGA